MNANRGAHSRWILLGPFFVFLILFWAIPLAGSLQQSLQSNEIYGEAEYVGLDNYRTLLNDPKFFKAVRNTLVYALLSIVLTLPLALLLAHLLRAGFKKARPLLSFILLLPGLTPPLVLSVLFLLVFHGKTGLLNARIIHPLGLDTIHWLRDPDFIMAALVIQAIWRWTGFMTFFILSGLDGIPRDYLDVARLEGAGFWSRLKDVTLPSIRHVLLFCGIYLFIDAFAMFSGAYILLGGSGGTNNAGLLLVTYTYQRASSPFFEYGTSAAVSMTMLPFLLLLFWFILIRPTRQVEART
ncbi:MAG: sugar ABC transporter permease [Verrucomicrobiota bacterium]